MKKIILVLALALLFATSALAQFLPDGMRVRESRVFRVDGNRIEVVVTIEAFDTVNKVWFTVAKKIIKKRKRKAGLIADQEQAIVKLEAAIARRNAKIAELQALSGS